MSYCTRHVRAARKLIVCSLYSRVLADSAVLIVAMSAQRDQFCLHCAFYYIKAVNTTPENIRN